MRFFHKNLQFLLVVSILFLNSSCLGNSRYSSLAKLKINQPIGANKSFSFIVDPKAIGGGESDYSSQNIKITNKEIDILSYFLKDNNYCINKKGKLSFKITSKQSEVRDVTFSNIMEEHYNIKSLVPKTYFGKCF